MAILTASSSLFIPDCWTWELPGGYVDANEDPAITAAREVEEETGWRARNIRPLARFQPMVGTAGSTRARKDSTWQSAVGV